MKRDRVLIICSRDICYSSGNFFASRLAAAYEELGYEARLCEFSKDRDIDAQLEPLLAQRYRVIVDFNSMLPRMVMEDGSYYLDHLQGPFFDYILDHPLFHYTGLTCRAGNLHVLVVDESHRRYVASYYPTVQSVHTLPLGACEAFVPAQKEGRYVLFMGTYEEPDNIMDIVDRSPADAAGVMRELIECRIAEPKLPMEEAYRKILERRGEQVPPEQFALQMNGMYAVDAYVRDYFRKKVVDALLARQIPAKAVGEGWYKYHAKEERFFTSEKAVTFALSFQRIARAPLLLNVTPFFPQGMHDRVVAGMANRTVVMTEENDYLRGAFGDQRELCFYDLTDMTSMCERAEALLGDTLMRREIEERAYRIFLQGHTWRHRALTILSLAEMAERERESMANRSRDVCMRK